MRQIFKNCRIFNEDDSEIGKAGHELRRYFETNWAHASRFLNSEEAASSTAEPLTEGTSGITASSSPECQESSTCAPSSVGAKSTSEVDDAPQPSRPLLPSSSEDVEVPTSPKSADEPTEAERALDSPCTSETVVGSIVS